MNGECWKMCSSCSGLNMNGKDDEVLTLDTLRFSQTQSHLMRASSLVRLGDDRRDLTLVGVQEVGLSMGHLGGVEDDWGGAWETGGNGRCQRTRPLLRGSIGVHWPGGGGRARGVVV